MLRKAADNKMLYKGTRPSKEQAWALRRVFDVILAGGTIAGTVTGTVPTFSDLAPAEGDLMDQLTWRVVNDSVMGGSSTSSMRKSSGGWLFSGMLVLRNGGFASTSGSLNGPGMLAGSKGLTTTLQGDGGRYKLTLRTSSDASITWAADVVTTPGELNTVELPWGSFRPSFRGRQLEGRRLDPAQVDGIGLMLSKLTDMGYPAPETKDGAFALLVKRLETF